MPQPGIVISAHGRQAGASDDQFRPACWISSCACLRELQRRQQRA